MFLGSLSIGLGRMMVLRSEEFLRPRMVISPRESSRRFFTPTGDLCASMAMEAANPTQDSDVAGPPNTSVSTVLVPIRYPLTATSTQTLEYVSDRLTEVPTADLRVLHVNLLYQDDRSRPDQIARAIDPIIGEHDPEVVVRRGVLLEEVIRGEAARCGADLIVLGQDPRSRWRRLLSRLLWSDPDIAAYLRTHTETPIEIAD